MKPRLDSRALTLFTAVAETLSFRQAAELLHLSQPPLSRAIRELEERLGVRLFVRDTRSVALTAAGRTLLARARPILRLLVEAEADMLRCAGGTVLRLGLTNAIEPAWFDGLPERVAAAVGGPPPRVVFAASPVLVRQLRAQRLDAAFVALPVGTAGLDSVEIERHPLRVALAASHPLAARRRLRLSDLAAETLFWFERARQPAFFDHCRRVFRHHGFAPATRREPVDPHVLLAEVASGRGIALVPATFTALRRRGVVYRQLAEGEELSVGIGLAVPADRPELRPLLLAVARA